MITLKEARRLLLMLVLVPTIGYSHNTEDTHIHTLMSAETLLIILTLLTALLLIKKLYRNKKP